MWTSVQIYGPSFLLQPGVLVIFAILVVSVAYPIWQDQKFKQLLPREGV
jgi:hypothetical protein